MAKRKTIRILLVESMDRCIDMGANRLRRDAGRQAREDAKQAGDGQVREWMHHGRKKDFGFRTRLGPRERLASYADNLERLASNPVFARDVDRAADHLRIASEAAGPVIVGENRDRIPAWIAIVILGEQTPGRGLEPERPEHPSRHVLHVRLLHLWAGRVC